MDVSFQRNYATHTLIQSRSSLSATGTVLLCDAPTEPGVSRQHVTLSDEDNKQDCAFGW